MDDDYIVEEFSDGEDDASSSSEDEFESFMKEQFGIVGETQDDFDKEMDRELTSHMRNLEETTILCQVINKSTAQSSNGAMVEGSSCGNSSKRTCAKGYSSGFTSKEVDCNVKKRKGNISLSDEQANDELLYDPDMDTEDQNWIDSRRRAYIYPSDDPCGEKIKPLPNSDAVLNCPACLSLLCLDCQRHELYKGQYRAMFVTNCTVMVGQTLRYPNKQKKLRKKPVGEYAADQKLDAYHPVRCTQCNTEVAVYDTDEVYHFFNVLASYS